jgi:hypothetical protein
MKQPSGRFVIRMPGTLHARLKQEAASTGQSLNQVCIAKLQAIGYPVADFGTKNAATDLIFPDFLDAVVRRWSEELIGLILFGSAARGDATEDSDIDLLLVMKPEVKISRDLYRLWDRFCDEHRRTQNYDRISPHFASLPGSVRGAGGLWYETAIEGIVLWESHRQVSRFLESVRRAMGHGKIRRRMMHGSPYWIKEF